MRTLILTATAALLSSAALQAEALSLMVEKFVCPYDHTEFQAVVMAGGTSDGVQLDGKPIGHNIIVPQLVICPTNGFIFLKNDYTDEELGRLKPMIFSSEFESLQGETTYYRAAWILDKTGSPHAHGSGALLTATWEADADPARYRKYATELLTRIPTDIESAANPRDKMDWRLLQVELLRRTGKLDEASARVDTLIDELRNGYEYDRIITRLQRQLITKGDMAPRMKPHYP